MWVHVCLSQQIYKANRIYSILSGCLHLNDNNQMFPFCFSVVEPSLLQLTWYQPHSDHSGQYHTCI